MVEELKRIEKRRIKRKDRSILLPYKRNQIVILHSINNANERESWHLRPSSDNGRYYIDKRTD